MKFLILLLLIPFYVSAETKKPTRLVFMVFDQMRPDYIDRFDLKNFKRLRKMGTHYKNAYVGHLGSVTVVSHAVMTTGLQPKDLPWNDNSLWDKRGVLGKPDQLYNTLALTQAEYLKLMTEKIPADTFLIKRFKEKTSKKVFSVGQKDYAPLAMGGPYSDTIIYAEKKSGQCVPFGVNVPERILKNTRYTIDCSSDYGTANSLYPLDGHRFYPGPDKAHLGGDIWVADLALDIMQNEKDWGALFLTFGSIDKFGHMLGETDGETLHSFETPLHLKDIAQIADAQLGRLFAELEKQKILNETLIISTADHGAQTDEIYLGNLKNEDAFWIQRLAKASPIRTMNADTGLRIWLKDPTPAHIEKSLSVLKELSQAVEIYVLNRSQTPFKYDLKFERRKTQSKAFQKWALERNPELVSTLAGDTGPDIVVALADNAGFGKLGDHGGLQEKVQRIPILVAGPGIKSKTSAEKMRLMDLAPLISKSFGL